jgi:endonuclease G, mitochondrial
MRGYRTLAEDADLLRQLTQRRSRAPRIDARDPLEALARRDDPLRAMAQRVEHMALSGGGVSARDLERLIGRNDMLRINYLARGLMAARTVYRIYVAEPFGAGGDWGTGFLVSPRLLLTNHHVIATSDQALGAIAEFDYEADVNGLLRQGKRFRCTPELGFVTSPADELDFTIIALAEASEDGTTPLSAYGFLRLDPTLHKVEETEFVTIIQHPNGDEKYVAIRENEVIKIGDRGDAHLNQMLWYASDTAPGSSGAPVFNDNWQVVAVHHRGVPDLGQGENRGKWHLVSGEWVTPEEAERLPDDKILWIANEGIRTSQVIAKITETHRAQGNQRSPLIQEFLDDATGVRRFPGTPARESVIGPPMALFHATESAMALPLERARRPRRNVRPLSYYDGREGYRADFLGVDIPLPLLTPNALRFGALAPIHGATDGVLRYTHFSVMVNATRRMAVVTAVNIDGRQWQNLARGDDQWYYDPRLPLDLQIGDELYGNEPVGPQRNWFDRGHLVRRLDPVWGALQTAALANDDTFHWTNCSPQYWAFNQGEELWQGLENFILYNTDEEDVRANVLTGPIFRDDDEEHRDVLIPQYYWKVIVVRAPSGPLYSSAYVVSQKEFAQNIPFERLPVGQYRNFQVSIVKLEQQTGIDFGAAVRMADVYNNPNDRPLRTLADITHPRR